MRTQALLAIVSLSILLGLGMLVHESGHFLAATCLGWKTHFAYSRVALLNDEDPSRLSLLIFKAAGPLVDVAAVTFGLLFLHRHRYLASSRTPGIGFWIATGLVFSAMRWLKGPFQKGCDEAEISVLLGLPWYALPWISLLPACFAIAYLLRAHFRERTLIPLSIGFAFGMSSFLMWYLVIGPRILPRLD